MTDKPIIGPAGDATTPLDGTHRDSVTALHSIREAFTQAHRRVAQWQPAPYPGGDR